LNTHAADNSQSSNSSTHPENVPDNLFTFTCSAFLKERCQ